MSERHKPVRVQIRNGQLCIWDDDPPESFGQLWMPVCVWCHNGPLAAGDLVCRECPARAVNDELRPSP